MPMGLSLYFDLFRFSAAFIVFASHLSYLAYTGPGTEGMMIYGHGAVMAFFVLSGYVIAFTTDKKHKTFDDYLVVRLARLYSVIVPALFLTPLLDGVGAWFDPALYQPLPDSYPPLRFIITALYLQESWWLSMRYFSNAPIWSLAYEFWYYLIFGALAFSSGWRRVVLIFLACLGAGPRILVLFPIWLLGVLAYRIHTSAWRLNRTTALLLFVGSLALIVAIYEHSYGRRLQNALYVVRAYPELSEFLTWSRFFLADYLVGLLFFAHILAAKYLIDGAAERLLVRYQGTLRFLGGFTFSLYVFHMPLIFFSRAVTGYDTENPIQVLLFSAVILVLCALLARVTEHKKSGYRRRLSTLWAWAAGGFAALALRSQKSPSQ